MDTGEAIRVVRDVVAVGWRAWTVQETRDGVRLGSVIHDELWTPLRPMHASCRVEDHPAPAETCNCGFHAARDPMDAITYVRGRDEPCTLCRVLGEVVLSGLVVETESGWRAAEAYPLRLYVPDRHIAAALAGYGVPVLSPACASASATSSTPASAGSSTSSWNAARMRSSWRVASG